MRCHYEVLSVSRDADESEIKTAYKKLALKWHPDKNLDNEENAKEQFQLVQQAYEVLTDKQERAWYDRHREQILHGANSEYADNNLDVFQYFTTSCFKGYGDDENGFYCVYRKVFEQIAKEDLDYYEDKDEFCNIPSFGLSTSDYDDTVHPFYSHWMSYSTKKSYVWLDPYDIKDVRDRRILKAVEKENKKVRQKAKKERNEEVRNLVAFVRKRDKRVQAWNKQNEAKIEINRKKQDDIRRQKLDEQRRLNESVIHAEWTKFENVTSELQQIEANLTKEFGNSESSDVDDESDLYCAACNKLFKTEKSFQNHEISKKHKENVELLKAQMLDEDAEYEDIDSEIDIESESSENFKDELGKRISKEVLTHAKQHIEVSDTSDDKLGMVNVSRKKKTKKPKFVVPPIEISPESESEKDQAQCNIKKPNKIKKTRNVLKIESSDDEQKLSTLPASTSSEDDFANAKKGKKKTRKGKAKKLQPTEIKPNSTEINENKTENANGDVNIKNETVLHICSTCKKDFPSKNKLFQHLKAERHSVHVPGSSDVKMKGRSNRKK